MNQVLMVAFTGWACGLVVGYSMADKSGALAKLRVHFAEWYVQEFPLSGGDALRAMGEFGLCSQEQANHAIKVAGEKHDAELPTADQVRGLFSRDDMSDEIPF